MPHDSRNIVREEQRNMSDLTPDLIINLPRTERGETARSLAASMNDEDLRKWANDISLRDFNEPYEPKTSPWLKDNREGWVDFIVGSFLP
jgi:hypothetical protein